MSIPTDEPGDRDKWMTMFSALDDEAVDALFDGRALPEGAELDDVAFVIDRLRASAQREPVPPMSLALRAQLHQGNVVPFGPALAARRSLRRGLVAAAAAAALVLVGVSAEQNRLPADLQDVVSSAAGVVGIHVPTSDERPSSVGPDDQGDEDGDVTSTSGGRNDGSTPGGATPADPGQPGDKTPATPATPPDNAAEGNGGVGVDGTPGATAPGVTAPGQTNEPTVQGNQGRVDEPATSSDTGQTAPSGNANANGSAKAAGSATRGKSG